MDNSTGVEECYQTFKRESYYHYTIIPASILIFILILYHYLQHRVVKVISPMTYLINNSSRLRTVMAFGSMANVLIDEILFKEIFKTSSTVAWYWNPFVIVALILEVAFIYYPLLICTSSKEILLSRILGCCYIMIIIAQQIAHVSVWSCSPDLDNIIADILPSLPDIICLFILLIVFIKDIVNYVTKRHLVNGFYHIPIIAPANNIAYVRELLNPIPTYNKNPSIINKLIYKSIPTFKYSAFLLSLTLVNLIFFFRLVLIAILQLVNNMKLNSKNELSNTITYLVLTFSTLSLIIYLGQMFRFLSYHRNNLIRVFKRQLTHKYKYMTRLSPKKILRKNLLFSGYFVAFTVFGALIYFTIFNLLGLAFFYGIKVIKTLPFKTILKFIYSLAVVPIIFQILQFVTVYRLFIHRNGRRNVLNWIRNLNGYHLTIYIMFFGNLLAGIGSSLLRTFSVFVITISSIGRLDLCVFDPHYFLWLDNGHQSYLSYLQVSSMYENPTMRCFCQILIEEINEFFVFTRQLNNARNSKQALNRWYLAVMLTQNPSLVKYRKHEIFRIENEISSEQSLSTQIETVEILH